MNVKEFTVERATWLRGTGSGALVNNHGKKCCLGFYGVACGFSECVMLNIGLPSELASYGMFDDKLQWPEFLVRQGTRRDQDDNCYGLFEGTNAEDCLAGVNDDRSLDDAARERQLTELFASNGVTVKFI